MTLFWVITVIFSVVSDSSIVAVVQASSTRGRCWLWMLTELLQEETGREEEEEEEE